MLILLRPASSTTASVVMSLQSQIIVYCYNEAWAVDSEFVLRLLGGRETLCGPSENYSKGSHGIFLVAPLSESDLILMVSKSVEALLCLGAFPNE